MATQSRVRAALATVEAADAAANLTELPGLLLPALMNAVGADSAIWTELDEAAGPLPVRVVSHPERLGEGTGAALEQVVMLAMALEAGSLHVCICLNRVGSDFTPAAVDLLTQLRPLLTRRVVRLSGGTAGGLAIADREAWPEGAVLTARQQQVLRLVAAGLTDAAIGHRLGCSPRTVDKHLEHVYRRLGVSCRTAAVTAGQAD
jgi:DNA-binding CsgD family transcriptional regulator